VRDLIPVSDGSINFLKLCFIFDIVCLFCSAVDRGPELTHLFAPPEELIFAGTAPDRAAINRMRDISQFSDEKTIQMSAKYKYVLLSLQCTVILFAQVYSYMYYYFSQIYEQKYSIRGAS
jgi:hypothetical protein